MARERMITRTVEITVAHVMCLNVETAEVSTKPFTVTGKQEEKTLLKTLKKQCETESFKLVAITEVTTYEKLYGMPESEFIALAKELPPRNI